MAEEEKGILEWVGLRAKPINDLRNQVKKLQEDLYRSEERRDEWEQRFEAEKEHTNYLESVLQEKESTLKLADKMLCRFRQLAWRKPGLTESIAEYDRSRRI